MRSVHTIVSHIESFAKPGINRLIAPGSPTSDTGVIDSLTLEETQILVDKCDARYYRVGLSQVLSDALYDYLKNHLKKLNPTDERLTRVGVPYSPDELDTKTKHTIPMGSLDNTDDGIVGLDPWMDWLQRKLGDAATIEIVASLKVDGGSICASYEAGRLVRVVTRGNGTVGEDITANAVNFQNLPTVLAKPVSVEVRGEAVLYVADFKAMCEKDHGKPFDQIPEADYSNPRNIGNGIFGRHDGQDSDKIRFLAFNFYSAEPTLAFTSEIQKLHLLKDLGFIPVPHKHCADVTEVHAFYNLTANQRASLPFEIDGVVVVVNDVAQQKPFITDLNSQMRPKFARAIKFPHKANTTTLESLEITVGHTRAIIPTANLKTVRIGGVNVDSALLNNFSEIKRLNIAIGDEVEVVLAGDIIPKVIRKVKDGINRVPIVEPTNCPACNAPTTRTLRGKEGAVTYCSNPNCSAAVFAKLHAWIGSSKKGVGILDIGDTMIQALWDKGLLNDPSDLYKLTADAISEIKLGVGRIGKSRAAKVVANIQAKKVLPLHIFLGSLGIELLGRRRVQILKAAAGGKLDTLDQWLDTSTFSKLEIDGLGDTIRSAIIAGMELNRDLIAKLLANGVTVADDAPPPPPPINEATGETNVSWAFAGRSFCWTGTRELVDEVVAAGGVSKSGISRGLDFLVQKDALSQSVKTQKAEALGTKIISIDYLRRMLNGTVLPDQLELPV